MRIITHNGSFHADDVFACATLTLIFKEDVEIVRTRDEAKIKSGDIIFDVGRIYDGEKYFDHHQEGGAGKRVNGIPYASFGLIWKHFGERLVSKDSLDYIDRVLVETVDALDNGVDISPSPKINVFTVSDAVACFNLVGHEGKEEDHKHDKAFLEALEIAKKILERVILEAKDYEESMKVYKEAFDASPDKRMVVVERHIRKDCISSIDEVLYVVHPYHNSTWTVRATRKNNLSFETKKPLPKEWAGKLAEDLQKITGVPDALFCHNNLFVANAKSKEGAIKLAQLALSS